MALAADVVLGSTVPWGDLAAAEGARLRCVGGRGVGDVFGYHCDEVLVSATTMFSAWKQQSSPAGSPDWRAASPDCPSGSTGRAYCYQLTQQIRSLLCAQVLGKLKNCNNLY